MMKVSEKKEEIRIRIKQVISIIHGRYEFSWLRGLATGSGWQMSMKGWKRGVFVSDPNGLILTEFVDHHNSIEKFVWV